MVPIPTEPTPVVVITVPPAPTIILSPAVNNPLDGSNFNFVDVENSFAVLNIISWLFPGENTLIVARLLDAIETDAVIAAPTKLSWVILLSAPTRTLSSKTLIEPGIIPPWLGIQYLSPGVDPSTETTINCCPGGTGFAVTDDIPTKGSPRFGSAFSTDKYLYLSDCNLDCGVTLERPERYFGIIKWCYFPEYYK